MLSLDNKNVTGHSILPQVLDTLPLEISTILSDIFNLSFETGRFIDVLRNVKVVPIFKNKGSAFENNSRNQEIKHRVPQGSVLGPILFLLYFIMILLMQSTSVFSLGLVIDENLSMNKQKENFSRKLRNANEMK